MRYTFQWLGAMALVAAIDPATHARTCPVDPPRQTALSVALGSPFALAPVGRVGTHTWTHVHKGAKGGGPNDWTSGILSIRADGSPLVVMSPLKARATHVEGTRVWVLDEAGQLVALDVRDPSKPRISKPSTVRLPWRAAHHMAVSPTHVLAVKHKQAALSDRAGGVVRKAALGENVKVVGTACGSTRCWVVVLSGPDVLRRSLRVHTLSAQGAAAKTVASLAAGATGTRTSSGRWLAWWTDGAPGAHARQIMGDGTLQPVVRLSTTMKVLQLGSAAGGFIGVDGQHRAIATGTTSGSAVSLTLGAGPAATKPRRARRPRPRGHGVDDLVAATTSEGTLFVGTRNFSRGRRPGRGQHSYWSASVFKPAKAGTAKPRVLQSEDGGGLAGLTAHAVAGPAAFGVAFDRRDGETNTHRWSLWQLRGKCR